MEVSDLPVEEVSLGLEQGSREPEWVPTTKSRQEVTSWLLVATIGRNDAAQYPVNRRIKPGEPAESYHNRTTLVQWSDKKCQVLSFPGRKAYGEVKGLSNDRVGGSVHEVESYWRNVVSWKVLSLNKVRIDEGVGRSGVHKGFKDRVWD